MELVRRWKSHRPQTPFLALTNGRDVTSAVEAMKNGVADCLVKPIDQDDLRSTAIQLLERNGEEEHPGQGGGDSSRKTHIDIPPGTSLEDLERAAVEQALIEHHGNRTHAAKTLGISVRTLQRKLKAWGMPIVSFPNTPPSNPNSNSGGFILPSHAASHHHLIGSHAH